MEEVILNLLPPFIALVGIQLCVEKKGTYEEFADTPGVCPWCFNPIIQMIYGITQITGIIFILGLTIFYTITQHWWYILLYIVSYTIAELIAKIGTYLLTPITSTFEKDCNFGSLRIRRYLGTLLIYAGFLLFVFLNWIL